MKEFTGRQSWVYIVIYASIIISLCFGFYHNINMICLYVLLPISFLLGVCFFPIHFDNSLKCLILLYLWMLLCTIFSSDIGASMQYMKQMLGCFIISYLLSLLVKHPPYDKYLFIAYILMLVFIWNYAINELHLLRSFNFGQQRLNSEKLNANMFAYFTFYATFSLYILAEFASKNKRWLYDTLLFLMLPLTFVTAMCTGSRQVILIQLPFFLLLFFLKYVYQQRLQNKVIFIISIILLGSILIPYAYNIYDGSVLQMRNQAGIKEDSRSLLLLSAIKIGMNNPIFGVGPGNVHLFTIDGSMSHNSFTEIFASTGLLGLLIFVYMVGSYMCTQIQRYRKTKDKFFLALISFGILWIVYQFLYVFYMNMWLIGFFIMISSYSDYFYRKKYANSHI